MHFTFLNLIEISLASYLLLSFILSTNTNTRCCVSFMLFKISFIILDENNTVCILSFLFLAFDYLAVFMKAKLHQNRYLTYNTILEDVYDKK